MQLCDKDILRAISTGELIFAGTVPRYPFKKEQIQPASVDLRLGNRITRFKDNIECYDIRDTINPEMHLKNEFLDDGESFIVQPNEVIFGQIYEQLAIGDNFSARVEGRSRVARLGISVHCTGSYINPGFCGAMPLQIINHNRFPVVLYPYINICQLVIFRLTDIPLVSYLERSVLPYNTYYNEVNPSPSILSADPEDGLHNQTIVEQRIKALIENYYKTIKTEQILNAQGKSKTAIIENATIQNFTNGGYSMGDQYNAQQAGNQGPNAGQNSTINQVHISETNIDSSALMKELEKIKAYLKASEYNDDSDVLIGDITKAAKALKENKKGHALVIVKTVGSKILDIAKSIGCSIRGENYYRRNEIVSV